MTLSKERSGNLFRAPFQEVTTVPTQRDEAIAHVSYFANLALKRTQADEKRLTFGAVEDGHH